MRYLTACSIVKNEDNYIDDFVEFNKFIGIEHFIFYDRSENPLSERFKGRSDITVVNFPEPKLHADAWLECLKTFGHTSQWISFFDIDQFFIPKTTDDIKVLLKDFESFGGLGVNWQTFGSGGNVAKPSVSQFEAFTMRAKSSEGINNHIQSIVQPSKTLFVKPSDPHHFKYKDGNFCVNENHKRIAGPFSSPPSHNKIQVNHYILRSLDEFKYKISKGRADISNDYRKLNEFNEIDLYCNVEKDELALNIYKKYKGI